MTGGPKRHLAPIGIGGRVECTPKVRQAIKGPAALNGGEQCWCPDKSIPVNCSWLRCARSTPDKVWRRLFARIRSVPNDGRIVGGSRHVQGHAVFLGRGPRPRGNK